MRLLIAYRSKSIAHALALLLTENGQFEVVGEPCDASSVIEAASRAKPDLVLVDPQMPGLNLSEFVARIGEAAPDAGTVVVTLSNNPTYLQAAVEAGARAYVSLDSDPDELVLNLLTVAKGQVVASGPVVLSLASLAGEPDVAKRLTDRELEVVGLVTRGATNKEIADTLVVTVNTAKMHLRNIYRKLNLRNRQELVVHAIGAGIDQEIPVNTDFGSSRS